MTKTKYLFILTTILLCGAIIFWGTLYTTLVIFALVFTTVILLCVYGFIRGVVLSSASHRLLLFFRFRFQVLNNEITVPEDTNFVATQLKKIEQQIQDKEAKEAQLRSSDEQQTITSFAR
ncbi:hypothetical protein [Candidatus Uabimicrobium amorphum]|uniref:Uncharacterized protein n=1 Tax=Uabimicrobium amorphum TaxID=2596890 RepID=A0A5S9IT05_UABAM|nr:hypothetical protein [Candidatus Uabimicrobium amorphum]BBM87197.1 hypothetical protein UABAM_05600 [Candidatus Uabimicrobium amorphum]